MKAGPQPVCREALPMRRSRRCSRRDARAPSPSSPRPPLAAEREPRQLLLTRAQTQVRQTFRRRRWSDLGAREPSNSRRLACRNKSTVLQTARCPKLVQPITSFFLKLEVA